MITAIEYVSGVSGGTTLVANLGQPVLAGDTLVVGTFCGLTGNSPTMSDSGSQTYTNLAEITGFQTHGELGLWCVLASASGITSITATLNAADNKGGIAVGHYRGLTAIDQHPAINQQNVQTPWASNAITTTKPNALIVALNFAYIGGAGQTTCSSPLTNQLTFASSAAFDGNNGNSMCFGDQIVSSIQTGYTAGGTSPSGITWNYTAVASFTAPSSALQPAVSVSPQLRV